MKEAIFTLASTLERMKKRGFDMPELVEKLHEKDIPVKAPTLAKYLKEFRRGKRKKAEGKTDTPPAANGVKEKLYGAISTSLLTPIWRGSWQVESQPFFC